MIVRVSEAGKMTCGTGGSMCRGLQCMKFRLIESEWVDGAENIQEAVGYCGDAVRPMVMVLHHPHASEQRGMPPVHALPTPIGDTVRSFLSECTEPGIRVKSRDLWDAFNAWWVRRHQAGEALPCVSMKSFMNLVAIRHPQAKCCGCMSYIGIELRAEWRANSTEQLKEIVTPSEASS